MTTFVRVHHRTRVCLRGAAKTAAAPLIFYQIVGPLTKEGTPERAPSLIISDFSIIRRDPLGSRSA